MGTDDAKPLNLFNEVPIEATKKRTIANKCGRFLDLSWAGTLDGCGRGSRRARMV
jgi:hypothetical protein